MKKTTTLFFLLCLLWTGNSYAQGNSSFKYEGRPMPDWVMGATPEPHNGTYYYKVFEGVHSDRETARNLAINKAFQQAMTFISTTVNSADVYKALEKGESLNVVSETFSIPIYFTCEFSKKTPDGTKWLYWVLCQIAVRGNITPMFDLHYADCNTHKIWDQGIANIEKDEKKKNGRALAASTFIPGIGQMLKGQGGSGAAFLISEIVLFGGGTACYFLGQEQLKTMKSTGVSYDQYTQAKKMKNTYDIAMYTAFGVGAAVHIGNMIHAWFVKDKHLQATNITFVPAIIPINEYSTPSYAYGAGVQIKF